MFKIKEYIQKNFSVLIILIIAIVSFSITHIMNSNNSQNNDDGEVSDGTNSQINNSNQENDLASDYYWISNEDYFYGFDEEDLIVPNKSFAFQFFDNNKCTIATLNDETVYMDGQVYNISRVNGMKITEQGVWFSNVEECTYEIRNNHIYISPNGDDNRLLNGEYYEDGENIEIIWNGEQKKTVYDNIQIKNDIRFYYSYILGYDELYEYEMFDYDVDYHINNNTLGTKLTYDQWCKSIISELNLDVSINEFYSFNERMLFSNSDNSLEYQVLFANKSLYIYGDYNYVIYDDEDLEQIKGKILKLYAPKRKLSREEVSKVVAKNNKVSENDIYLPDEIRYQAYAEIYLNNETIKNYLYK